MSSGTQLQSVLIVAVAIGLAAGTVEGRAAESDIDAHSHKQAEQLFAIKVLPLLKGKCFGCHGDDAKDVQGEFDVRSRAGLLQGGESGEPAIVPGKPGESRLMAAIRWEDGEMPPKENDRLTPEQIELIGRWIAADAPWPSEKRLAEIRTRQWNRPSTKDGILVQNSGGLSDEWTYRRYKREDVWAFQPVRKPPIPKGQKDARNPIDTFIDARRLAAGFQPAPQADPLTLLRRATYDLTGMPPTPK